MAEAKPLAKMNKTELLEVVGDEGVQIDASATVAMLLDAIEAHRAARRAVSQDVPTQPLPRDQAGRALDQWGLPFSGPARSRALAALRRADPNTDPDAWANLAPATSTDAQADAAGAE